MQKKQVQFFTTTSCHLCEQAYEMANYLIEKDSTVAAKVTLQLQEIANDADLLEKYGVRIPVLASSLGELGWPFELEELRSWLIQ